MKYEAVIFDLGGTLTKSSSWSDYTNAAREVAAILSAPVEDFIRLWFAEASGLATGIFPSYQDYITHVCRQLGVPVPDNQIDTAAGIPLNVTKQMLMAPRDRAIEVLTYLKTNGYKTGLISDCAADVPEIWHDTPFAPFIDLAIFSASVGVRKPDPHIYRLAIEQLAVEPEHCLYIGDGNSQELTGAAAVGMHPILIRDPDEDNSNAYRFENEANEWDGPKITSLSEVLTLL